QVDPVHDLSQRVVVVGRLAARFADALHDAPGQRPRPVEQPVLHRRGPAVDHQDAARGPGPGSAPPSAGRGGCLPASGRSGHRSVSTISTVWAGASRGGRGGAGSFGSTSPRRTTRYGWPSPASSRRRTVRVAGTSIGALNGSSDTPCMVAVSHAAESASPARSQAGG